MRHHLIISTCLAAMLAASPVFAGDSHHHAPRKQCAMAAKNASVKAYLAADRTMHKGMMIDYTGNADIDFVRGMIPHHQGAVDMAKVQLQYGKDEELKELARRIIVAQESEIGFMKQWLSGRDASFTYPNACDRPAVKEYKAAMEVMHRDMAIAYTGDADIDFARGMIPHHQGAVDMAWTLKKYGKEPALRPLTDDIVRSQQQEIRLMQDWLAKHDTGKKQCKGKRKRGHNHH